MKLRQLRVLDTVARHLNITGAAHELDMSQPAVSLQIKLLEQEYGKAFFKRTNRGIRLTPDGRHFLDLARPVLAEIDQLENLFKGTHSVLASRTLILGGSHTLSVTALPDAIAAFQNRFSGVSVELQTNYSYIIEKGIVDGTLDIGLITIPRNYRECKYEAYQRHEAVAFVAPDHPLSGRTLSLSELSRHPIVCRKDSANISEIQAKGYSLNLVLQCDAPESVKAAVLKGIGVGILFRSRVENELLSNELSQVNVPELLEIVARSYIVYSGQRPLTRNAQDFLKTLRSLKARAPDALAL